MSRLFIRVQTVSGSRTIITQDFTARDTAEVRGALMSQGMVVSETDATPVDMKAVLRRMSKAAAQSIPKPLSSTNVMPLRKPSRSPSHE